MSPLRWTALGLALLGLAATRARGETLDEAHYAELLQRHTRGVEDTVGTRVDYAGLARSADWRRLVANLAQADPGELSTRPQRLAFWINAYNILAIDLVVRNQPLQSIRDIGSLLRPVWKREAGSVGGRAVTLHEVEHEILRPMGEPRIHTAIVCASTSCPSLRREPWTGARLEEQLDDSLRRFLADPDKGLRIDRASRTLHLSRIFDWFEEDFADRGGVLVFVRPYLSDADRRWLDQAGQVRVRYLDYDWTLNALAAS